MKLSNKDTITYENIFLDKLLDIIEINYVKIAIGELKLHVDDEEKIKIYLN